MKRKDTELIEEIQSADANLHSLTERSDFTEPSDIPAILSDYSRLRDEASRRTGKILFRLGLVNKTLRNSILTFLEDCDSLPETVRKHNLKVAEELSSKIGECVNPVEGHNLDRQQMTAIAYDIRSRLIIAGAGTGKTATTVGLVKYLLLSGKASLEDILVLSFTNAAVDELKKRVRKETGQCPDITTFHRLGLKVIASADGIVPNITKTDLNGFIANEITKRKSDPAYLSTLNKFLIRDLGHSSDENTFESSSEMNEYLRENPLITLNGERRSKVTAKGRLRTTLPKTVSHTCMRTLMKLTPQTRSTDSTTPISTLQVLGYT